MKTETPQAPTYTKEDLDNYFRSAEGQQALRQSRLPQAYKPRPPMSEADQDKFCLIGEKTDIRYIRIDPATKQPLTEPVGEETFWRIMAVIPQCVGNNESEIRVNFQMMRYYKHKTYQSQKSTDDAMLITMNEPYIKRATNKWTKLYTIVEMGERIIDGEDFLREYKRDEE